MYILELKLPCRPMFKSYGVRCTYWALSLKYEPDLVFQGRSIRINLLVAKFIGEVNIIQPTYRCIKKDF